MHNDRRDRSCRKIVHEGFRVGKLSDVRPGDQIPLEWDLNDPHFVRVGAKGDPFTSDKKLESEFPGGFPIRSAFVFSDNAPKNESDEYPSHLEDVLEAIKGKSDAVYKIPESDLQRYIADGSKIIAKSIIDDIDRKIKSEKFPDDVKSARVVIYTTPSSSRHVNDYAEALRQNIESYMKDRLVSASKSVKSQFADNSYRRCAVAVHDLITSFSSRPSFASYFIEPYKAGNYKEAIFAARDFAKKRVEAAALTVSNTSDKKIISAEKEVVIFHQRIRKIVNDCVKSINEFEAPDSSADRLSTSNVDINNAFRKIPSSQPAKIQADAGVRKQFKDHLIKLGAYVNEKMLELELDLSTLAQDDLVGMSPYITKRWKSWTAGKIDSKFLTVDDLISDFENELRAKYPAWQKKMSKKTDFSISAIPADLRDHISDYIKADAESLPQFQHIAVVADDNMESGVSLREMRREFDRIKGQKHPPLMIYGAPLLLIRGQEPRAGQYEKSYSGRRKSNIAVQAPLSNLPEDSELYKKVLDRLKKIKSV